MVVVAGWKEFAFFDATPVRDPSSEGSSLYSDPELLDISPGENGTVFMSTRHGVVKEFDEHIQLVSEITVYEPDSGRSLDFLRVVPGTRLLLVVASKLAHPLEVTVWDLSKQEVHARTSITNATNTFPATAFCMSPDLSVMVLGFADGSLIAVRGDLLHDKGTKHRLVHSANTGITGLALTKSGDQVFVSSVNQVLLVSTTVVKSVEVLDKSRGADLGCTAPASDDQFLVARDTDLAWFNKKHRGPTIELPVLRKSIYLTKDERYLVVVATIEPDRQTLLKTETLRLMILDLSNHVVAFNSHLANGIKAVFEQWGRINVLGSNGMLYMIEEKPLNTRIALLKSRKLYQVAIKMAESSNARELTLMLHQDFADYLFEKNDVDASLKEYIAAIDLGQSSRAIRRFKDSQHAATLLQYLNALYERGLAGPQHVTLQIICYTKLGKLEELSNFLKSATSMPDFDFERAIAVLTELHDSRFARLAAYVAEQWPDPDLVVQIRLRHLEDVQSTLDYIQTVSVADALRILIQNSRLLLNKLPVETTGVLITLFTGRFVSRKPHKHNESNPETEKKDGLASGQDHAAGGAVGSAAVEDAQSSASTSVPSTAAPVLQSYQAFMNFVRSTSYLGSHIVSAETLDAEVEEPSYLPPRPRLIFPSFIGHNNEFVIFLEACLNVAPNFHSSEKDVSDIATTLFELYLEVGSKKLASELLDKYASVLYAVNVQATAQMYKFKLTAKQLVSLGLSYIEVFSAAIDNDDVDTALNVYYEHVNDDPSMSAHVIRQLTSKKSIMDKLRQDKPQELEKVCHVAIASGMSPVQVVTVLSASPLTTIGDVRPFLCSLLKSNDEQVERHKKLAESYEREITAKREALAKQTESPLVFQYNNCSQCHQPLDLPAYHFACQHSYHQQCIGPETECPVCLPENESIRALQANNEETAAQQEYFLAELSKKQDKMKLIFDFISRGGLSKVY